jgi:cytoskeleton protein RodZ
MWSMDGEGGRERQSGVGSLLCASRLRAGLTLAEAAEFLNIRRSYLHAIEEERYGDLPGPPYAVGFVRGYAEYLGLDGNEVTRRFRAEMAGSGGAATRSATRGRKARGAGAKGGADLHFPLAASETATPSGSVLLVGAMLAVFAYGGWYVVTASDGLVPELVAPLPERLVSLLPDAALSRESPPPQKRLADQGGQPVEWPADGPVVPDGSQPVPGVSAMAVEAAPDHAPDVPVTDAHGTDAHVADADGTDAHVADGSASTSPAPDAQAAAERPRVSLEASEESWIEIRDRFDKRVLSRLLAPGDVLNVPDQAGLRLTVGNAGGLVIRVDGQSIPPLGGSGVVLRNVPLEWASLQQGGVSAN